MDEHKRQLKDAAEIIGMWIGLTLASIAGLLGAVWVIVWMFRGMFL